MARAPEVFSIDPADGAAPHAPRDGVRVVEVADAFVHPVVNIDEISKKQGNFWLRLLVGTLGAFLSLVVGLWAYEIVVDLMGRWPVLGYLALGLAVLALLSLAVVVAREVAALARLGSAHSLRAAADEAQAAGTVPAAHEFISKINRFYKDDATTARARAALETYTGEIIDGPDLIRLAERELMAAKDQAARAAIASAASKVAMVTTLSPRAWVDIGFVLFQGMRLIGQIATLYNGRPGGLAIWRLSARVLTHLAITGGVAVAQDALSQVIGAGLAGRLSSKLGEGVLNGVLTARVGLSAIAVCRPMRFSALPAPTLSDVAGALMPLGGKGEKSAG